MKVLHIPTGGLLADGIFSCISAYVQEMDRTNLEITILATNDPDKEIVDQVQKMDCQVAVIPYRKNNTRRYIIELYRFLTGNSFDIVHVHGSSSIMCIELLTAMAAGCKVRIAHSHSTRSEHKKIDRLLRPVFNHSFNYAFACGEDAGKWMFGNRKYRVLPNARNLKKYEYNEKIRAFWRNKLKIPPDGLVIGHVGHFNYTKNHEYIIHIFKEIVEENNYAHLVLIGTGELFEKIKREVHILGISNNVHFMGAINNVGELLSAMDIMLLPSRYEGLPMVVIEWQISGLPCIISDSITDECMLTNLVEKLSVQAPPKVWADAVRQIVLPDRNSIKIKIQEDIRKAGYDIEFSANRLKELYESFLMEKNK